jgi:hypothetical protein
MSAFFENSTRYLVTPDTGLNEMPIVLWLTSVVFSSDGGVNEKLVLAFTAALAGDEIARGAATRLAKRSRIGMDFMRDTGRTSNVI